MGKPTIHRAMLLRDEPRLQAILPQGAILCGQEPVEVVLASDYATLEAERDKLAEVLGDVEREHDLIRRMKNCEIQRGRRSFGIAVMSDPPALEWQALDKELQKLIDARHAALASAPATGQGVNQQLLEALEDLVRVNEQHNSAIQRVTGTPAGWKDDYLNLARAAIAAARQEGGKV